jgi:phage protein U
MKSFAVLALAATALAQTPSGCSPSTQGTFQISTVNVTNSKTKRDLSARQAAGTLTLSLQDGNLKDQAGRTGYIASNYQYVTSTRTN